MSLNLLSYFTDLKLSVDQNNSITKLDSFFASNDKVFLLKGYAGTGKTTILSGLTKALKSHGIETYLMAPTGRAALVMQNKTKIAASTIHKLIYNLENLIEDNDTDQFKAYYGLNTNPHSNNAVYFIDESSMISNIYSDNEFFLCGTGYLLNDLFSFCKLDHSNRKIVFIGDPAQLPPVNMSYSPALDEKTIEKFDSNYKQSVLSYVFRQTATSSILESATHLRTSIEKEEFGTFDLHTESEDLSIIDTNTFESSYLTLAKTTLNGIDGLVVIAHSNKQALNYNFLIRKMRYKLPGDCTVRNKEKLLVTKNSYGESFAIFNGTIITVKEVHDEIRVEKIRFTGKNGTSNEEEIRWRDLTIIVDTIDGPLELQRTIIENVLNEPSRSLSNAQQIAIYVDFKNRMRNENIIPRTEEYRRAYKTDKYFNALRVKYGYAITCHKSQGGEWESVIIDFETFIGDKTKAYYRWAYTALTRAKSRVLAVNPNIRNPISSIQFNPIGSLTNNLRGNYFYPNPENNDQEFLNWQLSRLNNLCNDKSFILSVEEHQFLRRLTLTYKNDVCTIDLRYNSDFFTSLACRNSSSDDFFDICSSMIDLSRESTEFSYQGPDDHRKLLFEVVSELCDSLEIQIINIRSSQWSELYFFKTKAECAVIEFYFNAAMVFGNAIPKSTLGSQDELLVSLISKLS